jgi:uracil-DNA glycosylase family 4
MDLEELSREILTCAKCPLHRHRKNAVPGEGSMKLGDYDSGRSARRRLRTEAGRPFVGAAGQLLTEALARLGVSRWDVYITNVVKCRPPNNRTPTQEEVEACLPYLLRQIELLRPRRIVALGLTSAKTLLHLVGKRVEKIGDVRGRCFRGRVAGVEVEICATYHPAAVLRNPRLKEEFMGDLAAFLGGGLERFF